jgi:L,D-transpeptidase ErfK/SrfK
VEAGQMTDRRWFRRTVLGIGVGVAAVLCLARIGWAGKWTEEDFYRKQRLTVPYVAVAGKDAAVETSVLGSTRFYYVQQGDTFLDLARYYGLGYNEITEANPGVDPWVPPVDQAIVLPTEWVLPQAPYEGLVINIPEMRLYYFHPRKGQGPQLVSTFPVGLGRDEWRTPKGKFRVQGKTRNPEWIIPESIREERIREKGRYEKMIPGGDPQNPLGAYRLELSMPGYRIHGTNIPWGVGMQVSHGCIRLYPEDIEQLFPMVPVGTPGQFIYQPIKIGARGGRIYAQVHKDIYTLIPGLFSEARRIVDELGWGSRIDVDRLRRAVEEQSGVPLDITLKSGDSIVPEEDLRVSGETAPRPRLPDGAS